MDMEFCVPLQIVEREEFEALELAIEAAESAAARKNGTRPPLVPPLSSPGPEAKPGEGREATDRSPRSLRRLPRWKKENERPPHRGIPKASAVRDVEEKNACRSLGPPNMVNNGNTSDDAASQDVDGIEKFPWGIVPSSCRGRSAVTKCRLPYLQFKGEIIYTNTVVDAENHAEQLMKRVEARKYPPNDGSLALGLDTEWKVIFKRGAQRRKVSVLQLCMDAECCYVFHVIHSGIPKVLQDILEDPLIAKVGICVHGDAAKLSSDYGVTVKGVKDLGVLANLKLKGLNDGATSTKNWSLSSLSEELLGKQIEKAGSVRMGDWEVNELSTLQLEYAATDAFASLYLFQVLQTFPDPQMLLSN